MCVRVCTCYLHYPPYPITQYDEETESRKAASIKRRKLDAMEEQWRVSCDGVFKPHQLVTWLEKLIKHYRAAVCDAIFPY